MKSLFHVTLIFFVMFAFFFSITSLQNPPSLSAQENQTYPTPTYALYPGTDIDDPFHLSVGPDYPSCLEGEIEIGRFGTFHMYDGHPNIKKGHLFQFSVSDNYQYHSGKLRVLQGEGHGWDYNCPVLQGPRQNHSDQPWTCINFQPEEVVNFYWGSETGNLQYVGGVQDSSPGAGYEETDRDNTTTPYVFEIPSVSNGLHYLHLLQPERTQPYINSVYVKGTVCGVLQATPSPVPPTNEPTPTPEPDPTITSTPEPSPTIPQVATPTASASATPRPTLDIEEVETDISLRKVASANQVYLGEYITYKIAVENNGNQPVSDLILEDDVPDNFEDVSWTCERVEGSGACDDTAGEGQFVAVTMDVGEKAVFVVEVRARVTTVDDNAVRNNARVRLPGHVIDTDNDDNTALSEVQVLAGPPPTGEVDQNSISSNIVRHANPEITVSDVPSENEFNSLVSTDESQSTTENTGTDDSGEVLGETDGDSGSNQSESGRSTENNDTRKGENQLIAVGSNSFPQTVGGIILIALVMFLL